MVVDTVSLTILERVLLGDLLPQKGNFVTMKVLKNLQEAITFTEEEIAFYTITQVDGRVSWTNGDVSADIPIGPKARQIVLEALEKASIEERLTTQHVSLYEKFVGEDA